MRLGASDSVLLAGFVALAAGSIALKAWAGPPRDLAGDQRRDEIAAQLAKTLSGQGFATSVLPLHIQSSIVFARRGGCRLSVRDARGGTATVTQYAHDAAAIGPVRYWYKGSSFDSPPTLRMRVGRLESELLGRAGAAGRVHVPIALASSPECGPSDFGLGDISLTA